MALRKASSYSKKKARPFTRNSRSKGKAYIKTIPFAKIAKFNGGNQKDYEQGKHKFVVRLISEENVQIRDNALEAARMFVIKMLDEGALGQYYLLVRVHPHHMLRENKTAAGAGADRLSKGMTQAFGVAIGRSAIVSAGDSIAEISCANDKAVKVARAAMAMAKAKVPSRTQVVFEKLN